MLLRWWWLPACWTLRLWRIWHRLRRNKSCPYAQSWWRSVPPRVKDRCREIPRGIHQEWSIMPASKQPWTSHSISMRCQDILMIKATVSCAAGWSPRCKWVLILKMPGWVIAMWAAFFLWFSPSWLPSSYYSCRYGFSLHQWLLVIMGVGRLLYMLSSVTEST